MRYLAWRWLRLSLHARLCWLLSQVDASGFWWGSPYFVFLGALPQAYYVQSIGYDVLV